MDNCHTIHVITKVLTHDFRYFGIDIMYFAVLYHVSTAAYLIPETLLVINGLNDILVFSSCRLFTKI